MVGYDERYQWGTEFFDSSIVTLRLIITFTIFVLHFANVIFDDFVLVLILLFESYQSKSAAVTDL